MISGIIFDLDGLVVDTERFAMDAWLEVGKKLGVPITYETMLKTMGRDDAATKDIITQAAGPSLKYDDALKLRRKISYKRIDDEGLPAKPGLYELFDYLSDKNYTLGLATSSNYEKADTFMRKLHLRDRICAITSRDYVTHCKPHPEIYEKACERIGMQPEKCLALEDSPMGVMAAHGAGMRVVMIPDIVQPEDDIRALTQAVLPSLQHVIQWLEENNT